MLATIVRDSADAAVPATTAASGRWVRHGLASLALEPSPEAEVAQRRAAVPGTGSPFLVAASTVGDVPGHACARPCRTRPPHQFACEDSACASPGSDGMGLGRGLPPALAQPCGARGWRLTAAVVGDSASAPSIGLHQRLGSRRAGPLPLIGWRHGRWVDSVPMARPLGPGSATPPAGRA